MENKNYYDILGVSVKASLEEITAAKNALAKKYHPDANLKNGIDTTSQMQEILEAYHILSDQKLRQEYDQEIKGHKKSMQTFDLHEETTEEETPTFVTYWKASGELYEIICKSDALYHQKDSHAELAELAVQALKHIVLLRNAQIPERYWHPDVMNWLLFTWYQNRNYTTEHLLTLYDEHVNNDVSRVTGIKLKNQTRRYQHSVKKLLKY